ncbi:PSG1 PMA1 stabilization in the Golgi protein 1 [Candida maltosa Xu316]
MKVLSISLLLSLVSLTNAAVVPDDIFPQETPEPQPTSTATPTNVNLFKRMREVIINKDYAKMQAAKTQSSTTVTPPPKWIRTYEGKTEIVTPTIIEGVTFSARPPETTNGLEWWVSLKDDGSPKTIKPQNKNGQIKNGRPDYSTWFESATTVTYNKEQLQAHNMADDEIFEEVQYIKEADLDTHLLSPLIRCTPDRYKKKGIGRDKSTEPICTPKDNAQLKMDKTYFITWYSRFFDANVKNVKIHLSHIRESLKQKGLKKRSDNEKETVIKRSSVLELGGKISESSFYSSPWISNDQGFYPIYINESWFGSEYWRKVLLSIQPEDVSDEEFNIFDNSVVVEIWKGSKVSKDHLTDLKKLEEKYANRHMYDFEVEEGIDFEKYMMMIGLPTCVVIAAFGMWLFVKINKVDLSKVRKRKFAREQTTHRRIPFVSKKSSQLPQFSTELGDLKHD